MWDVFLYCSYSLTFQFMHYPISVKLTFVCTLTSMLYTLTAVGTVYYSVLHLADNLQFQGQFSQVMCIWYPF